MSLLPQQLRYDEWFMSKLNIKVICFLNLTFSHNPLSKKISLIKSNLMMLLPSSSVISPGLLFKLNLNSCFNLFKVKLLSSLPHWSSNMWVNLKAFNKGTASWKDSHPFWFGSANSQKLRQDSSSLRISWPNVFSYEEAI